MATSMKTSQQDSEPLYRAIFEGTLQGMEIVDAETGRVVLANQAIARIFGFASPEEMIGIDPVDCLLPEDKEPVARIMAERLFEKDLHQSMDLRALTKDGKEIWISALGVRIEYQGRLAGLISVCDITTQKLAEKALDVSGEENRLLMQNADEAIVVAQEGVLKFTNLKAMELTGYSEEEGLNARPFTEFIHPDDRQMVAELYLKKLKGEQTPHGLAFRVIAKEGHVIWFGLKVVSFTWKGKPAVWCFMKDITERKRAEEALRESDKKYRQLIETINEGIWSIDKDARTTFVNTRMVEMLGYTVEEMVGRSLFSLAMNERGAEFGERKLESRRQGIKERYEVEAIRKDGTPICISVCASPILDDEGQYAGSIAGVQDITDRKLAEELMKQKEEYFRSIIENSSDVITVLDASGTVQYQSPNYNSVWGRDSTGEVGKDLFKDVHPDDVLTVGDAFKRILEKPGDRARLEIRARHGDGSWRVLDVEARNLLDHPAVHGIVVNFHDVTERRQAEEELRDSEQKFRAIFDNANDGFISVNPESGRFFNANTRMMEMLGYESEEEIENLKVSDIHPEKDLPYILGEFEKHARGEISRSEDLPVKRKDGSVFFASISSFPLRMADKRYLSCIFRDVTEHRKAEKAVKDSEERYRLLAENISDAIWVTDMNLRPTYISPSHSRLTGYSNEEAMARGMDESLTPASLEAAAKTFAKTLAAEHGGEKSVAPTLPALELEMIRKDGSTIWVASTVSFIRDADGRPIEMVGVLRDITDRKKAELALQGSEDRFRGLVETTSDFVWEVDEKGIYVYVSPRIHDILGYDPQEVVGKHLRDFVPSPDASRQAFKAITTAVAKREPFSFVETTRLHKKGRPVVLESSGVPFFDWDGRLCGYRGIDRDVTERLEVRKRLEQSLQKLQKTVDGTVEAITLVVEARDPYTAGHQRRVARLACAIAEEMGYSSEQLQEIRIAGLVHDVGKVCIPNEVLSKPGNLSEIEYRLIKTHCRVGYGILRTVEFPWPIAEIILQHHERMNGSGYPLGLKGNEIVPVARILGVADVVEAMTSHRPYRPALGIEKALDEISRNSGIQYDADVVYACLKVFHERGFIFEPSSDADRLELLHLPG